MRNVLKELPVTQGLTSLAVGADQLFAKQLFESKIPYLAVIPCERYERTFKSQQAIRDFQELLNNASEVETLPFGEPTETAFFAAGKFIVEKCDTLVAVWNGLAAKGLGGTGDIVSYAKQLGVPVIHLALATRKIFKL